jgi:outer membrane receptor for ferrienterochelin and colicins
VLQLREQDGIRFYDAGQFARFAPRSALEMVRQVPGFRLEENNNQDRGFGQASENVLINGVRVSGKNNDAIRALGQITASSVLRLELLDGATLNVPGISGQVINVVTEPDRFSGTWVWFPTFRERMEDNLMNGSVNTTGKLGNAEYTLGVNNSDAFRGGGWGPQVFRDADGNELYTRQQNPRFSQDRPTLTGSWAQRFHGGNLLNARLALQDGQFDGINNYERTDEDSVLITEQRHNSSNRKSLEAGVDYEFGLGVGRLKVIGLHRNENNVSWNVFQRNHDDGTPSVGTRFDRDTDTSEDVLRGEYRWKSGVADWQLSLEGALNVLDSQGELSELDGSGGFQPVPLPGADTRVEERRQELMLTWGRPLSERLSLQASLGGEHSRLGLSGEQGQQKEFWRPKGLVSFAWKARPGLDVSYRFERRVGQLDFYDFLASVDTENGNNSASNPDLVPPQSWYTELQLARNMGTAGSATLKLFGEWISDIVEHVPIGDDAEAVGNLDSAERFGAELTATLLLDPLGWRGAKVDVSGRYWKSRLTDPLTAEQRRINNDLVYSFNVSLRHDLPDSPWAWGAGIEDGRNSAFYRLDYSQKFSTNAPMVFAFLEHKDVFGLRVRASVVNIARQKELNHEVFYVDRRDGPVDYTVDTSTAFGYIYRLNVSGSF